MDKRKIAIVGAGGFAREVAWLIREINRAQHSYDFLGYIVSDLAKLGQHDSRTEVLGDYSWLENNVARVDALAIGIGSPASRLKVAEELTDRFPHLEWPSLIHPSAQFDQESCEVGRGVQLCAGVIGTVNLVIEPFVLVNLSCTIGHEARIGRGSVLNPTVNISGGVVVGQGVLIGTGAQVLQYVEIGAGATIGAGAVVNKSVELGDTVVGIPAKSLKKNDQRHAVSQRSYSYKSTFETA